MDANEGTISKWLSATVFNCVERKAMVRSINTWKMLEIYDNILDMKINKKEWKYGRVDYWRLIVRLYCTHYKDLKKVKQLYN